MLLEAVIYEPNAGGYQPHIKWSASLIKLMGGNQKKGLNEALRAAFPDVVSNLNKAGINSKGREMYAKGIIPRIFDTYEEALQALSIYNSIIKSL
jgi:hypothetical protein